MQYNKHGEVQQIAGPLGWWERKMVHVLCLPGKMLWERERKRVGDGGGRKVSQGAEKGMLPLECFKGKEWKDVLWWHHLKANLNYKGWSNLLEADGMEHEGNRCSDFATGGRDATGVEMKEWNKFGWELCHIWWWGKTKILENASVGTTSEVKWQTENFDTVAMLLTFGLERAKNLISC